MSSERERDLVNLSARQRPRPLNFILSTQVELDKQAGGVFAADGFTPAAEIVAELDEDEVTEQLDLHNIAYDPCADVAALRSILAERMTTIQMYLELELDLQYPGILPSSMYPDPLLIVACVLHLEMRVGEKILCALFTWPLKKKLADAEARIKAGQQVCRACPLDSSLLHTPCPPTLMKNTSCFSHTGAA